MVSNHEFFNVLSPNGPLCPPSALPGSLKIIEDLSLSEGRQRGGGGRGVKKKRGREDAGQGEKEEGK